jgi:hypothetical protein
MCSGGRVAGGDAFPLLGSASQGWSCAEMAKFWMKMTTKWEAMVCEDRKQLGVIRWRAFGEDPA